ncbi:MAG: septum formation family protein, partial [Ornithinimicrobium sp.]
MTRRLPVSLPLVALVLGLSGCSMLGAPTAEVGECVQMSDLEAAQIDSIPTVDCSEEHDGQVVATFEGPDGDYPSAEEWQTIIREGCTEGFEDYVGITYEDSTLTLRDLSPT